MGARGCPKLQSFPGPSFMMLTAQLPRMRCSGQSCSPASQDAPWCSANPPLYRQLAQDFPAAKFILTVRDVNRWWNSTRTWVDEVKSDKQNKMHLTYSTLLGSKSGFNESEFKARFTDYNQAVIRFFHDELQQPPLCQQRVLHILHLLDAAACRWHPKTSGAGTIWKVSLCRVCG